MHKISIRCILVVAGLLVGTGAWSAALPVIAPNDNSEPAGTFSTGVLNLSLVAEPGTWYPETDKNPGLEMRAFREEDESLLSPAPMVRVPEGTRLDITIRNNIPDTLLAVYGFQSRPSDDESVLHIPYGETRHVEFDAGPPGTYFYWATTEVPLGQRSGVDSQLSGAFIVDPADQGSVKDKVFVLGEWLDPDSDHAAYTINGLVWPYTPRLETTVGQATEWRWINTSSGNHPMHLHGSYYDVVTKGTMLTDTTYALADQRSVVTERVEEGTTMKMRWTPEYEGNWLMHCHIVGHVTSATRLAPPANDHHGNHAEEGMSGMVIGIHATPAPGLFEHEKTDERHITMHMQRKDEHYDTGPGFAVGFDTEPTVPGPPLLLTRGETVNIELVNDLGEPTSVHWHGMELESYYDGVAGFGGTARSITPQILSDKTFNAIFTPPRAGTFIYHTHMDDLRQLQAGLYGAMIVSDPDKPFDPEIEHLFVIGLLGFTSPETIGINGELDYRLTIKAGRTYRLRIINITASNGGFTVTLTSSDEAITWQPVAEDGADLPDLFREPARAFRKNISVGQTFDFEWTPEPGTHWFEVRRGNGQWMAQARVIVTP